MASIASRLPGLRSARRMGPALIVIVALGSACTPPASRHETDVVRAAGDDELTGKDKFPFAGFPVLPPRADANPEKRLARDVMVPTTINVERSESQIGVGIDRATFKSESLLVGENMIVGFAWETDVLSGGKVVSTGRRGLGTPGNSVSYYNASQDGIPRPGEKYTVEVRLTVFETDLPPQHFWSPESGKYRVLTTKTLRGGDE